MTAPGPTTSRRKAGSQDTWQGRTRSYDLAKEFVVALIVIALAVTGLALVFSSPDEPQVTLQSWSKAAPNDFMLTAAAELDGTSGTAQYGAPYNKASGKEQKLGPVSFQHLAGVTHRVATASAFVTNPLSTSMQTPALAAQLSAWAKAPAATSQAWAADYDAALQKAVDNDPAKVAPGEYGPVPSLLAALLGMAQNGALDGELLLHGGFYQTDYTQPLLFIADGTYLKALADHQHLTGTQWGMMNETGNYPGQPWLWLYTFWYQVKPFSTSGNADALVWGLMMVLSAGLLLLPFIPGLRSIPRWIPVHRLIWRSYYHNPGVTPT